MFDAIIFFWCFVKGKILPGFVPKKNELVIDIGCGDKPFWRGDVFIDKISLNKDQRISSSDIQTGRGLFLDCDITKIPFTNKLFDFSFCSHVLEHVERPDLAIKEILRISKNGYLEVPCGSLEMLYPYQSHLWYIFMIKGELIFIRKSKSMHQMSNALGSKYKYLIKLMRAPFIQLYWKNDIKYKIINDVQKSQEYVPISDNRSVQSRFVQSVYLRITNLLRKAFYLEKFIPYTE